MYYTPRNVPHEIDETGFFNQEFRNISYAAAQPSKFVIYQVLHMPPTKLIEGMEVLADGIDWDPGSGAGKYYYLGGTWKFLG